MEMLAEISSKEVGSSISQAGSKEPIAIVAKPIHRYKPMTGDAPKISSGLNATDDDVIVVEPSWFLGDPTEEISSPDHLEWTKRWLSRYFDLLDNEGMAIVGSFPEIRECLKAKHSLEAQSWHLYTFLINFKEEPGFRFLKRSNASIRSVDRPGHIQLSLLDNQSSQPLEIYQGNGNQTFSQSDSWVANFVQKAIRKDIEGTLPETVIGKIQDFVHAKEQQLNSSAKNYFFSSVTAEKTLPPFKSELINGDVLQVLYDLPTDEKYDVVIADPPYNIGKNFGNNSDKKPLGEYIEWTEQWLSRCLDLLTDDGIAYVYGFPEILARIAAKYPIDEQRWLAWHYTNKATPSSRFWQRSHESILTLWKPGKERPKLEIDQIREPYTEGYRNNIGRPRKGTVSRFAKTGKETTYKDYGGALPRDIIKIPALAGGAGASERWFMCRDCKNGVFPPAEINQHRKHNIMKHPTQKPTELTKRLIRSRINGEGGRVLIPFAGSGSECIVAAQMGLEWLGIEINPEYVNFAKKWMKKCTA